MNKLERAARQLLSVLESGMIDINAVTALREALDPELQFVRDWNEGKVRRVSDGKIMGVAKQAEQEPVGRWNWNEAKFEWLTKFDYYKHHMTPLYAAPVQQAEQEPVAWRVRGYNQFKTGNPAPWRYVDGADKPTVNKPDCCDFEPLYAAPVRTKDLTDDEIMKINVDTAGIVPTCDRQFHFARAVIAADREKNK